MGQSIRLNEIVTSNGESLYDEDGDTPDWIELHNPTNETINIFDFGITDDFQDLSKWTFPSIDIEPNDFLIVFASNKNRENLALQWDAKVNWGDSWSYWVGTSEPITDWQLPETNTDFWSIGESGFGYGDNDDNTEISQTVSVYIKKVFEVDDSSIIQKALFHIDYDDGYVAYLNGMEFSRRNLGESGSFVFHNTTTTGLHEAEIYSGGFPEEIDIDLSIFPIVEGTNTLAIQVHNYSNTSSDMSCIPFLTLGYDTVVEGISEPYELMPIPNSFLHTNFRLNSEFETLLISDPNETILDSITIENLETDMSYGRYFESENWALFDEPTPGISNSTSNYLGFLSLPELSLESGFYDQNQLAIEMENIDNESTIYFTLDGSIPTTSDLPYEYPITLNATTVLRARTFLEGWIPSKINTKTYILNEDPPIEIPTIFISTDPNSFFNEDTGMYVMGPNADVWNFPYFGANFWEDWERPIHFEILELDGSGYSADAGAKIFGGWSRAFPQKSLSIFSRSHIGPSTFEYQLFPDSNIDNYEAFVLRNSGNDWESTVMRDGFITSLARDLNIDHQRYRPAALYLNGEFWGIQNIREKVNEHFISANHSISPENIDLLDIQGINDENIVHGTNADYKILINYLETQEMNDPIVENALENWIDIESYMAYQAFQIFVDNRDWPGNNIKFWRDHRIGGKWRWILYDTDFGFGIWDGNAYNFNTLAFALDPNGPGWPNPPWSTFVFRRLMQNDRFKDSFINTYCDLLNTVFMPNFLISTLDSISNNIENMIPIHRDRWFNDGNWPNSATNWGYRLDVMENFSTNRRTRVIGHMINEFNLPNLAQVTVSLSPDFGGSVKLNTLDIIETNWNGYYFPTIPIEIKAIQNQGFQFSHWLEFPDSNATMKVSVFDAMTLTAVFLPTEMNPGSLVINEINYNSSDDHDSGDWIEVYNPGELDLNISGWRLTDDNNNHSYVLPDETILESNQYLVIANDMESFFTHYENSISVTGPFDFGLGGGGDEIKIYNNEGTLIDSVNYDDDEPWPLEADGTGPTLELLNPNLDNSLAGSWSHSLDHGSPGAQNTNYLKIDIEEKILPTKHALLPAYPNPFNGIVTIPFELSSTLNTTIIIFNILGEKIKEIPIRHFNAGKHLIKWNGENKLGMRVGTGIYFAKLNLDNFTNVQKLIYLK
ncbi:MAG: CotH kinase family protein [Candidatus Neomarinimicrobiota bacterium]